MSGHTWKLDEKGEVDLFALDWESEGVGHNGPICDVCDYGYCMWCPRPEDVGACDVTSPHPTDPAGTEPAATEGEK